MHTSASFEKLLHDHGHYLDDLYIITVRYVNYLEEQYEMAYVRSEEVIRDQFDDKTYSYPWYHDERWDEAMDTLESIEAEVDELYKIVEGMDYI